MKELISYLLNAVDQTAAPQRFILGIVGCPGAGKSTLSDALAAQVNAVRSGTAVVVPMDGFHRYKRELEQLGLMHRRGVPSTFDAQAFVAAVRQLRQAPQATHSLPCFVRSHDDPQADMISVLPSHLLVIVEGNYLLLGESPWSELAELLDETWYLDADKDTIMERLIQRHMAGGMSRQQAAEKIDGTDAPNAALVAQCKSKANRIVKG